MTSCLLVSLLCTAAVKSVSGSFVPKVHAEVTNVFEELGLHYNENYLKIALEKIKKQSNETIFDALKKITEKPFLNETFSMTLRTMVADGLSLSEKTIFAASLL
ncbi:hypothetical protein Y032_0042g529 [Ancylostoma ceylanicum]|uniref:Uncharacterized protein n=1 Tax=Ancylostoma ceylanicum TaxID=53326 RepID=A0A016UFU3_9BILA|nr:hypothetical protein Y032_0042g529 [Ancylostoma ceylanicum]